MSVGQQPSAPSANTWTEPPWSGWIETTGDALLILEAARRGLIPRVTRRLVDSERRMITSGNVFVFDEEESGIKRWTDGLFWSPSRILGNFLLYRETDKRGPGHRSTRAEQELIKQEATASSTATRGLQIENQSLSRPRTDNAGLSFDRQRERALIGSLSNSYKFKEDGLIKKSFCVTINGVAQHLVSYYKIADVESGRLRSPSSLLALASLDISPEYLDKTHFRNPPKVEIGTDGIPRYRGESDDIEGNSSISVPYQLGLSVAQGASETVSDGPPRQTDHPPGSTSVNTENMVPAESKFEDNEPLIKRPTPPSSSKVWTQDPRDGQWTPTPPNAEYYQQDDVLTQEMQRAAFGSAEHMRPPVQPGREGSSSAGMFTNAQVKSISGGTFLNVAHIYEYDAPAQGGGPAFPIAVLGLQAVSFAMRSPYTHYSQPSIPLPLLIPESTTTSSLAIHLPLLYQDLRTVIGPLALWLLIKTWIQRRSLEYH